MRQSQRATKLGNVAFSVLYLLDDTRVLLSSLL